MKKKLFAMALCVIMVVAMAVPAFAQSARDGLYVFTSRSNGECLNAYTEGPPTPGTRVTTYRRTGSTTQEWITVGQTTDRYVIQAAIYQGTVSPLVVCNIQGTAYLQPLNTISVADRQIKMISEGSKIWGLALVDRSQPFLALTASSQTMPAGGHSVVWAGSNGLSNQLWNG